MKEGVTKTGFHFSLEDDAMDNMELVEELANMQENDLIAITRVVTMGCLARSRKRRSMTICAPRRGG